MESPGATTAIQPRPAILAVGPSVAVRRLLSSIAARNHWSMEFARGDDEGLQRLSSAPYDLVMAGLTGAESSNLPDAIRSTAPGSRIIVLSHRPRPEAVMEALFVPVYGLFAAPLTEGCIEHLMAQALSSSEWEDDIQVASARPDWLSLRVRCRIDVADRLLPCLYALKADLPPRFRTQLMTALREVLLNGIEHGGKADQTQFLNISYIRTARAIFYHLADPGEGFTLSSLPHSAVSNTSENPLAHVEFREQAGLRPGGFGILLARSSVDEMLYNAKGNEVLLVKYLNRKG